jgi:pentalenene synthase
MLRTDAAVERYRSWRIAELAARCWPSVNGDDLRLAADLKAFYFLFDDQFDRPDRGDASRMLRVCEDLCRIARQEPGTVVDCPVTAAFQDLWRRAREGMSVAWRLRTACDWERYFSAQAYEALTHGRRPVPTVEEYFAVRRGTAATESVVDMSERFLRAEPVGLVLHSPALQQMRRIAAELPFVSNDVYSYEKEAARGDVYNLVVVLRHVNDWTTAKAVAHIRTMVHSDIARFLELQRTLPAMCDELGLTRSQAEAVVHYGQGLADWLRGHNDWMTNTARYASQAASQANAPGYIDELLSTRHSRRETS